MNIFKGGRCYCIDVKAVGFFFDKLGISRVFVKIVENSEIDRIDSDDDIWINRANGKKTSKFLKNNREGSMNIYLK